ncbi:MAG TPA: hypothetical protein VJL58_09655 [Pyrinomonadaceae bacterium]|nr:hypothetical protein [Pyrinomonadaceae bacterium]
MRRFTARKQTVSAWNKTLVARKNPFSARSIDLMRVEKEHFHQAEILGNTEKDLRQAAGGVG